MGKKNIRPIALCVFRQGDRILLQHSHDPVKDQWLYRPLGGGIEFGESSHDAAIREIQEELGTQAELLTLLGVVENRFVFEGKPGHEIMFIYDAVFTDATLYGQEKVIGQEGEQSFEAHWVNVAEARRQGIPVYPQELQNLLTLAAGAGHEPR
jgi:8-oxo-dGTP pyrophosphatase MutT (NUDIX family)